MAVVLEVASGVVKQPQAGVFVGATDFREFPLDLVDNIATLTAYNSAAFNGEIDQNLSSFPEEGQFLIRGAVSSLHAIAIDSFQGVFQFGEILVRQFMDDLAGGGIKEKGGVGILTTSGGTISDYLKAVINQGGVLKYEVGKGPLAQAVIVSPNVQPVEQPNKYQWFRMRFKDAGSGETNIKLRHDFLTGPPNGSGNPETYPPDPAPGPTNWQVDADTSVGVPQPVPSAPTRIGFMHSTIGPQAFSTRAVSFVGFTTDPDNFAIPIIKDPTTGGTTQGCGGC